MANIKKATENKAKDACKNQSENKKSKIYSAREENITVLAAKEKVGNQKDHKNEPIILR